MTWALQGLLETTLDLPRRADAAPAVAHSIRALLARWDLHAEVEVSLTEDGLELVMSEPGGTGISQNAPDDAVPDGELTREVRALVGSNAEPLVTAVASYVWWDRLGSADEGAPVPAWFEDVVRELVALGEQLDVPALRAELELPRVLGDIPVLVEKLRPALGQPVRLEANAATLRRFITQVEGLGLPWDQVVVGLLGELGVLVPPITYAVDPTLPDELAELCLGRLPIGALVVPHDSPAGEAPPASTAGSTGGSADGSDAGDPAAEAAYDMAYQIASMLHDRRMLLPSAASVEDLLDDLLNHVGSGHTVWFARGVLTTPQLVHVVRRQLAAELPLTALPALMREVLARLQLLDPDDMSLPAALDGALAHMAAEPVAALP